jgi:hypothetical protein
MGRWAESRETSNKGEGEMWDRPLDGGVFGILGCASCFESLRRTR